MLKKVLFGLVVGLSMGASVGMAQASRSSEETYCALFADLTDLMIEQRLADVPKYRAKQEADGNPATLAAIETAYAPPLATVMFLRGEFLTKVNRVCLREIEALRGEAQ